MAKENLDLGRSGEEAAVDLLQENGYNVIARNYRTRLGEIDIIAYDKDTLCFIEVKTRSSGRFGLPQEALSKRKENQIAKAALIFIKERGLFNQQARFDVVSVITWPRPAKIKLIKDAFVLDPRFSP